MAVRLTGVEAPDALRAVLLELIEGRDPEAGEGPLELMARLLDVATPSLWGNDVRWWIREQVERMTDIEIFENLEDVLDGGYHSDDRINAILQEAALRLEMVDGAFVDLDEAAEELEVADVTDEARGALRGKYGHVGKQWRASEAAMRTGDLESAVAHAVNALEGTVRTATQKKSIHEGLKALFPAGPQKPLVDAINQLHNYGSAMPNVRHGGAVPSTMDEIEARGVIRATAVWIVMIINFSR